MPMYIGSGIMLGATDLNGEGELACVNISNWTSDFVWSYERLEQTLITERTRLDYSSSAW